MDKNPIALSLSMLNKFSSLPIVHKLGIYKPAQTVVNVAVREGFRAGAVMGQRWKQAQKLLQPERLPSPKRSSDLFDLNVSEEQQMMRDMAQRFAEDVLRPAAHGADEACAPPAGFDAQLGELGLGSLAVPEALGGAASESSVLTSALVAEDLAHGDLGLAMAALAPIGVANALVRWGSADQQARYLPAFAEASPPAASLAVSEPLPLFEPRELKTRATVDGNGFVLHGEKALVPLAESAELFLVLSNLVGSGPRVFIVPRETPGVSVSADPALGARAARLGRVVLDGVRLPNEALLGERASACDVEDLIDLARIGACALTVGTAQAVLSYVIQYANDRVAFGEPISNRQAVAFMIANIGIELESMRLLTWRAASRAEQGLSFHREAYLARAFCVEKGMEIGSNGVQLLGGHGYIKDHPVERWYRDLMTISVMEGAVLL